MKSMKNMSNKNSKNNHSLKEDLLHTILHILPKKIRNDAVDQINYYLKEFKYRIDEGQKFVLSFDKIEIVINALVVYQRIISPIGHSTDFYERMTYDFNVSTISVGSYSLNNESAEDLSNIVDDFKRLVNFFFMTNGIKDWVAILSAENIDDLIRILRVPEYE